MNLICVFWLRNLRVFYMKRNLECKILSLLEQFPIVVILGARQCGKTTLARQLLPDWKYIDLENPLDHELIQRDPIFFFQQYPRHVVIDEAQDYPELFRVLRGIVDVERQEKGRFLLTGSSSPELLSQVSESLAGRVAMVHLGTLKANEYYDQPLSEFYQLFQEELTPKNIVTKTPPLSTQQMQTVWFRGGYPEPVLQQDQLFYERWMDAYRDTYVNRDIAKLFPRLNKRAYQRFLYILSKLSGTIINRRDLARAIEISEGSVREYLTIIEGTFLWNFLPSFEGNAIKSIIKMPKGYLRDTGLLHHLLRINSYEKLYHDPLMGNSFEAFVIEELLKGMQATFVTNWRPFYYRTRDGAEIDLILEGPFGMLPIEIKHGVNVKIKQLTALIKFVEDYQLPFGMLINQSEQVQWLTPKIVQIPVGWL